MAECDEAGELEPAVKAGTYSLQAQVSLIHTR